MLNFSKPVPGKNNDIRPRHLALPSGSKESTLQSSVKPEGEFFHLVLQFYFHQQVFISQRLGEIHGTTTWKFFRFFNIKR